MTNIYFVSINKSYCWLATFTEIPTINAFKLSKDVFISLILDYLSKHATRR